MFKIRLALLVCRFPREGLRIIVLPFQVVDTGVLPVFIGVYVGQRYRQPHRVPLALAIIIVMLVCLPA